MDTLSKAGNSVRQLQHSGNTEGSEDSQNVQNDKECTVDKIKCITKSLSCGHSLQSSLMVTGVTELGPLIAMDLKECNIIET